ncbi:MAG: choice-of-anchor D domain-containing protein, partial [Balneolia bacterium]|nr:choice-of-anchor D domain-containing protein [Balneolia bacterium]
MIHFHNLLKGSTGLLAVLMFALLLTPAQTQAQSSDLSLTAQERSSQVMNRAGIQTMDRQAIMSTFSEREIETLYRLAPGLMSQFDVSSLETILAYTQKTLTDPSLAEQQVIEEFENYLSSTVMQRGSAGLFNMNVVASEDFSGGVPDGWTITDDEGNGFVWALNEGTGGDYDDFMAVDSDDAGQEAGRVASTLTTEAFDISGLDNINLFLAHDYRHLGGQTGTVEWTVNDEDWNELVVFDENNRFAEDSFDITEAVAGESQVRFRFVFDDDGGWNWWWALDEVAITTEAGETEPFVFEIPEGIIEPLEFFPISATASGLIGPLAGFDVDFVGVELNAFTWTNDFAILITDGDDLETADILYQIGGFTSVGDENTIELSWPGGVSSNPSVGEVEFPEPIDMEGLTFWYGNGYDATEGSSWTGTIEFVGEFTGPEPDPDLVWDQPATSTQGIVSAFFNLEDGGTGAFSADDFEITETVAIDGMTFDGFFGGASTPADVETINIAIFADADGEPAGNPETSLEEAVWTFQTTNDGAGVTLDDGRYIIDLDEAGGNLVLEEGVYWISFYHTYDAELSNDRWNWFSGGPAQLELAKIITPGSAFGGGFPVWTNLTEVDAVFSGLAFSMSGGPFVAEAQVQVIHNAADPALAEVDVYVNGDLFASDFPFRGATEYLTVPAGEELTLEITAPGSTEALLELAATPETNDVLTVIAQGVADPSEFAPNPDELDIAAELVVIDERQVGSSNPGEFDFYVFHGATDAPAVDIFVRELDATIVEGAAYGDATGYFSVPGGEYAIEVRPAGSSSAVAVFLADVAGLEGLSAGILASGFLSPEDNQDGEAFALAVVLQDGTVVTLDALAGPVLSVNPEELAFGDVVDGFDSTLPVTFTNLGTSNLVILDVESDNAAFSIDFEDSEVIAAGGSATFNVTFAPDAVGEFNGELTIESTDPDSPATVALSGNGIEQPVFAVEPEEIEATLAAGDSDTFELTISNDGNGDLEFAFPAYIMERILDGTDAEFDAVRSRMVTQVRSAFENTTEAREANLQRVAANMSGESAEEAGMAQRDSGASLMSDDGFLIEFEGLTLSGGEFITVTDGLSGELTAVAADFVIDAADGGTWANDFGILFTTEELETGAEVDPETVVLQVGGLTNYGSPDVRIPWGTGSSGTPGTPVDVTIDIPTPLDVSGLYVSIGHAWTPGGISTWSGSVNLIGTTEGADFITEVVPAMGVVAPGDSETITLTLDAADLIGGVYTGVLGVETNDPANLSVDIPATLTVEGEAAIAVDPDEVDFGSVVVGLDAEEMITVSNSGTDVLSVTGFSSDSGSFIVESAEFDLEPGESADVMVTFAPEDSGSQSGTLTFESNAGEATVALSGEGQDPGILAFDPESLDVTVNVGENGMVSFTMTNEGVAPFDFSLGGGLVENGARFISPSGNVTEVSVPEQDAQRSGSSEAELSLNTTAPDNIRGGRGTEVEFPFVNRGLLDDEIVLTHSVSQVVEPLNGVRCGSAAGTADNSYIRTYTLPDFDIDGDFNVTGVQFGLESITGSLPVEARIYLLEGDLVFANMTLLGTSAPVSVSVADEETVITIPVEAEVPAGSTIVVEAFVAESTGNDLFPGTNSAGETAPSYIAGEACSIFEPTPYAEIGFPEAHLILNVVGEAGDGLFVFEPATGTIEAGQTVEVEAEVNSFELEPGSYNAEIQITTTSPATPVGVIPVSLEVLDEDVDSEMITFQVDMTVQEELDNFRPDLGDEVYVRGSFNDWSVIEGDEMVDNGEGV